LQRIKGSFFQCSVRIIRGEISNSEKNSTVMFRSLLAVFDSVLIIMDVSLQVINSTTLRCTLVSCTKTRHRHRQLTSTMRTITITRFVYWFGVTLVCFYSPPVASSYSRLFWQRKVCFSLILEDRGVHKLPFPVFSFIGRHRYNDDHWLLSSLLLSLQEQLSSSYREPFYWFHFLCMLPVGVSEAS